MKKPENEPVPLTAEEAERIVRNAGRGLLDTRDPEIRRLVSRAQRAVARQSMWGDAGATRHRRYLWWGIAFLALWVAGLAIPLMVVFGWLG